MTNPVSSKQNPLTIPSQNEPREITSGIFGATIRVDGNPMYLRGKIVTKEDIEALQTYSATCSSIAGITCKLGLRTLIDKSIGIRCDYEKDFTGFTDSEYHDFYKELLTMRQNKKDGAIIESLQDHGDQASCMYSSLQYEEGKTKFFAYATKNPEFSFETAVSTHNLSQYTNFRRVYNDVTTTLVADFSEEKSCKINDTPLNPHYIFQDRFHNISMPLQTFVGSVAHDHFGKKTANIQVSRDERRKYNQLRPNEVSFNSSNISTISITTSTLKQIFPTIRDLPEVGNLQTPTREENVTAAKSCCSLQ